MRLFPTSSLKRHQVDVRALQLRVTRCDGSCLLPSSDTNLMRFQWWRTKKSHWRLLIISPYFPVNILRAISWPREGVLLVKNLMLRHPLQGGYIPIGGCTVLLGNLGVLIFLVCKTVTRLITILPFCIFSVHKNRHTLYLIWRSPILICLN